MLLALILAATATVQNCGKSTDLATYVSGDIQPNPPVVGQNLTLSFTYTMKEDANDGNAIYGYNVNYIPYPDTVEPLCTQTTCPLLVGTHTETTTSEFPDVSGRILSTIKWETTEHTPILCVKYTFTV